MNGEPDERLIAALEMPQNRGIQEWVRVRYLRHLSSCRLFLWMVHLACQGISDSHHSRTLSSSDASWGGPLRDAGFSRGLTPSSWHRTRTAAMKSSNLRGLSARTAEGRALELWGGTPRGEVSCPVRIRCEQRLSLWNTGRPGTRNALIARDEERLYGFHGNLEESARFASRASHGWRFRSRSAHSVSQCGRSRSTRPSASRMAPESPLSQRPARS